MVRQTALWSKNAPLMQKRIFEQLLTGGKETDFGKDHWLKSVNSYQEFREQVPIRDYEGLKPYIEKIKEGNENVLWPGRPLYLSKTSGTTSGIKFIPITRASMPNHIDSTRNALLSYIHETGKAKSHLEIFENNGKFGGKIVKLLNKPENSLCDKCEGDEKNKPLMGMVLVKGLYLKDGYWQGGTIMDPNKGSTYGCSFWFETGNADILNVKGKHWTGLSRTQKWYRVK